MFTWGIYKMNKYQELLKLARESIQTCLEERELEVSEEIKKKFSKKQACFVTLTVNDKLRGCIGSLEARQELWADVAENARNAAFSDFRFPALRKDELKKVKIEISVLTAPKKLDYKNEGDLLNKIKGKGVVIRKGVKSATYLPQVWEEISDTEDFISSLCLKAGLGPLDWIYEKLDVFVYDAEKATE